MKRKATPSDPDAVAEALERLGDELTVLRDVLDEILVELQWANRNRNESDNPVGTARRITSMPLDPAASDWAERLNRFSAADLPAEKRNPPPSAPGHLF